MNIKDRISAYYVAHKGVTQIAGVFAGVIVVVGSLLTMSKAAGSVASTEVESGTKSAQATQVADTTASGSQAVKFGSAVVTPSSWPDSTNTGYLNAPGYPGSLHACATPIVSNTTYQYCDFSQIKVGDETTTVSNVSFYGCRFKVTAPGEAMVRVYGNNITFDYTTFQPDVTAPPVTYNQSYQYAIIADGGYSTHVGAMTVDHSNFWGFHDAIPLAGSTGNPLRTIKNSWFHDTADTGGIAHVDGIGDLDTHGAWGNVTIDHNRLDHQANSSVISFQYGPYNNIRVTNNYIAGGGGYAVEIGGTGTQTSITFTDNTYATQRTGYGPLYPTNFWSGNGNLWRRNKWLVPAGAAWGNPTHSGWFWMPVSQDASSAGTNDGPFVSQTDYNG
ncbi:MAG: hypothetical protein ABIR37_00950 [Candidatus Saccharimonadales bacterium]